MKTLVFYYNSKLSVINYKIICKNFMQQFIKNGLNWKRIFLFKVLKYKKNKMN